MKISRTLPFSCALCAALTAMRAGCSTMHALGCAAGSGARSLHVVAGARARPFYEASGYRFVGTVATDFALAAELRKDLL
jgi:hypothetical protein